MPITKELNPFLDYDSFLDCSDIKERAIDELIAVIEAKPASAFGQLHRDDFLRSKEILRIATTLTPKILIKYGLR
jgi:hypothetical protein